MKTLNICCKKVLLRKNELSIFKLWIVKSVRIQNLLWSVFSRIRTEFRDLQRKTRDEKIRTSKNSEAHDIFSEKLNDFVNKLEFWTKKKITTLSRKRVSVATWRIRLQKILKFQVSKSFKCNRNIQYTWYTKFSKRKYSYWTAKPIRLFSKTT